MFFLTVYILVSALIVRNSLYDNPTVKRVMKYAWPFIGWWRGVAERVGAGVLGRLHVGVGPRVGALLLVGGEVARVAPRSTGGSHTLIKIVIASLSEL